MGSTEGMGICHAYAPDGRCISLLKILLTNHCIFDCHYCINRKSANTPRARFTPQEVDPTPDTADFETVADFLHRGVEIALELKASRPAPAKMKEFRAHLAEQVAAGHEGITALKRDVHELAEAFPMPGK